MPTRDRVPEGAPCWIVLSSSDVPGAREFYSALFGWTAADGSPEFGGYFDFSLPSGEPVAGCQPAMPDGSSDVWSVYLCTDDAQKTVDAAAAEGGSVIVAPMQVAEQGTMAIFTDAGGAVIGVWQPDQHPGLLVYGEPSTPAWFELFTRDYDASVAFYQNVLRWDTAVGGDEPSFRYTIMVVGEEQLAGVMDASGFLPDGVPAHWSVYFGVADTDATLARIVELGGSVVAPAEDTPYGRLATAADPTGAVFKLVAPNDQMPAR